MAVVVESAMARTGVYLASRGAEEEVRVDEKAGILRVEMELKRVVLVAMDCSCGL